MMENCVFCKIISGEFDSAKIWEDDDVLAFLDVSPLTKGHCLVIPKTHCENIFDIDEEVLKNISIIAKKISIKINDVLKADGIRLAQSNGKTAGQEVMHFHLHIIPRYEGDGLSSKMFGSGNQKQSVTLIELKELASKIKLR